jgi:inhibitor of KinA
MIDNIDIYSYGDSSMIIKSKKKNNKDLTLIYQALNSTNFDGVDDIIKTVSTIGLIFNPYKTKYSKLKNQITSLIVKINPLYKDKDVKEWKIPVCYSKNYGLDLEYLSNKLKLSTENIIKYHKESTYKVSMIGFLPGFVYLDYNNPILNIPRKNTPRSSIPDGSIAIARNQTGIYNLNSPGGWNIIGKTPKKLFNKEGNPPIKIKEGDIVKFYEIDEKKFKNISRQE